MRHHEAMTQELPVIGWILSNSPSHEVRWTHHHLLYQGHGKCRVDLEHAYQAEVRCAVRQTEFHGFQHGCTSALPSTYAQFRSFPYPPLRKTEKKKCLFCFLYGLAYYVIESQKWMVVALSSFRSDCEKQFSKIFQMGRVSRATYIIFFYVEKGIPGLLDIWPRVLLEMGAGARIYKD